jgi:conjugal transfer/type IV secretion protein DotA/TraY
MAEKRNRREQDLADVGRETLVDDLVGRDQWKRSKIGYLTGAGPLRQSMSTIGRTISEAGTSWRMLWNAALKRDSDVRSVDVDDPVERFRASMFVHGKTEADVIALQRRSHSAFYLYAVLAIVALLAGAIGHRFIPSPIPIPFWISLVFRFAAVPMLGAFAFRWGFTNFIVRNRSYLSAGEYLRSGDWFPQQPPAPVKRSSGRSIAKLGLTAAVALGGLSTMPGDAFATTPSSSDGLQKAFDIFKLPGSDDLFMNLLSLVLPNVGPVPGLTGQMAAGSPAHNSLSMGLMIFSGILLMVACTTIAWHTITGTVMSAQTGKVLGERWSQVWSPARVVVGLGFLMPISGGFCGAQILVLYLVAWGCSAANMIWVPYVQGITNGAAITAEATSVADKANFISNLPGSYDAVRQIAERELCYETAKTVFQRSGISLAWNGLPENLTWQTLTAGDRIAVAGDLVMSLLNPNYWQLGDNSAARFATQKTKKLDYGICGTITVSSINDELSNATVNNSDNVGMEAAVAAEYDKGRFAAIAKAQEILRPIMQAAAKTYFPASGAQGGQQGAFYFHEGSGIQNIPDQIKAAVQAYNGEMLKAAQNALTKAAPSQGGNSANGNLSKVTNGLGWASAGLYYSTLARIQGVVYSRATYPPSFSPEIMGPQEISPDNQSLQKALYSNSETQPGTLADFRTWWIKNNRSFLLDNERAENAAMAGTSTLRTSLLGDLSDGASWWLIDKLLEGFKINPFNAMLSLVELGQSILSWITALGATIGVLSFASLTPAGVVGGAILGGAGKGGVIGSFFLTIGVMILSSLFVAGITLAYVLPMIPYLIVTFFVMSMLILVAEAMVAAPLWAFFHVRMEGQEFVEQHQRPGYMISFNLLLRPSLMILGLIMSYLVHGAMAWFVWQTFKIAAKSATAGFSVGPVGAVVFLTMYAYLNYMIAVRCFNLATQVPDRVARWFGGQGENTDEERQVQQATGAISRNVSGQASKLIDGGTIGGALGIGRGRGGPGGGGGGGQPQIGKQANLGSDLMRNREAASQGGGGYGNDGGFDGGGGGPIGGGGGGGGPGGGGSGGGSGGSGGGSGGSDQPRTALGQRLTSAAADAGRAVGAARRWSNRDPGGQGSSEGASRAAGGQPSAASIPPIPRSGGSNGSGAGRSRNGASSQERERARRQNADPEVQNSAYERRGNLQQRRNGFDE